MRAKKQLPWVAKTLKKAYEHHMASLPDDGQYDLLEELKSGSIINHLSGVSLNELKTYVRAVYIESAPPAFIIRKTYVEPTKVSPMQYIRRLFNA